jgi:hypothetical protein
LAIAEAWRSPVRSTKTSGFRAGIERLVGEDEIPQIVDDALPDLARRIGEAASSGITERHIIPMFRSWRKGDISTLDRMKQKIIESVEKDLSGGCPSRLDRIVAEWQNDLQLRIDQRTRPICTRWGMPADSMTLHQIDVQTGRIDVKIDTNVATEAMRNLGRVLSVAVAGIVSRHCSCWCRADRHHRALHRDRLRRRSRQRWAGEENSGAGHDSPSRPPTKMKGEDAIVSTARQAAQASRSRRGDRSCGPGKRGLRAGRSQPGRRGAVRAGQGGRVAGVVITGLCVIWPH